MKPLQTHGRRVEKWHPPAGDRFTEYGPEDEKWMRPLGLGTVRDHGLAGLYDVVDEHMELVGYYHISPTDRMYRGLIEFTVLKDCAPVSVSPSSPIVMPLYEKITMDTEVVCCGRERWICWKLPRHVAENLLNSVLVVPDRRSFREFFHKHEMRGYRERLLMQTW